MHDAGCGREPLIDTITAVLVHEHARDAASIRRSLTHEIDEAGPDALASLSRRLAAAGSDWGYYGRDPLVRRIHHVLARAVFEKPPIVRGVEQLAVVGDDPVVLVSNHLSYSDANVIDLLLEWSGAASFADRLTVIAGPKVYSNLTRRFSSLCFATIKTPQSRDVATDEAAMDARDVARAARLTIQIARERLAAGEALLVFPEGTRSRSGRLQPFRPAAARYLVGPANLWLVPIGLVGTDALFPIDSAAINPAGIEMCVGAPIRVADLHQHIGRNRRGLMETVRELVADLLPEHLR
jgi:1-acyl-sn-glycerol-3-phosphate acyltransferase